MLFLSGGGVALTVFAWRTTTLVADRSKDDPWPLAYSLYGVLGLVGIVLLSLGWVIGKTAMSGSVAGASFNVSGGESDGPAAAEKVAADGKAALDQSVDEVKNQ